MPSKRPLTRIRDIIENGDAILDYTAGIDFAAYRDNHIVRDATERCFARISEAAVKLASPAEELFPSHDWVGIRHLGNVLQYDYKGVIDDIIWASVTKRLPPLLDELKIFIAQYPDDQETL